MEKYMGNINIPFFHVHYFFCVFSLCHFFVGMFLDVCRIGVRLNRTLCTKTKAPK